ncbi:DUF2062 domain-containing protein [Aurantiacibacter spongiae]|uniref:DUF2062 domain-containing protein n=2 Tax=Aurantiacibacter spongiae TaxID=2488860 RepID=A0A3N5CV56_9SPHN|nr:DUF2062 domain-containing protein [Aurantiacibacter spongiae]
MPEREEMQRNRWLAPISNRFGRSELWRFTRRSVPRGAALGLFAAFIVPLGQIFLAAFLALPARANVPIAALITFVTNPFTVPFWLVIANKVGRFVLKVDPTTFGTAKAALEKGWWVEFGWWLQTAGVTAFGFVVLSVLSAAVGYLVASFVWRIVVARRWYRRPGHHRLPEPAE